MSEHHHQYGLPDLRQLVAGRTHFQGTHQGNESFFAQSRNLAPQTHHFESIMVGHEAMLPSGLVKIGGHHHDHYCTNATNMATNNTTTSATNIGTSSSAGVGTVLYGSVEMESANTAGWIGNDGGNNSRWPRQETLTLLEIRSRLDSRFKEANQKGPLWDEVSRIMAEEHGYQRSGKKCREKFENLYKYYKKTKEGKAGRQDGKHYRFFRQLEALYGEPSNQASASDTHFLNNNTTLLYQTPMSTTINQESQENKHSESLSFSNTSEFDQTSSSENNDDDLSAIAYNMMNRSVEKQKGVINESQSLAKPPKKSWKSKVKDFVDSQMKKLIEKQDDWMEKMLKTIEEKEHERTCREEEWTKQELARFDQEHEFWAKERAWIEGRDAALMESLKKHTEKGLELSSSVEQIAVATQRHNKNQDNSTKKTQKDKTFNNITWTEPEILSFMQLRTSMESRFQESGYSSEELWEELSAEMASLGYDRSVDECKEKWESMNIYFNMTTESNKKRKEGLRTSNYFQQLESFNGMNSSPSNSYVGSQVNDNSCFQVQINEGDHQQHLWNTNKFDLKLNKEKNQQVWHKLLNN